MGRGGIQQNGTVETRNVRSIRYGQCRRVFQNRDPILRIVTTAAAGGHNLISARVGESIVQDNPVGVVYLFIVLVKYMPCHAVALPSCVVSGRSLAKGVVVRFDAHGVLDHDGFGRGIRPAPEKIAFIYRSQGVFSRLAELQQNLIQLLGVGLIHSGRRGYLPQVGGGSPHRKFKLLNIPHTNHIRTGYRSVLRYDWYFNGSQCFAG